MIFKQFRWRILLRVLWLFATLSVASWLLVRGWYIYLAVAAPVIVYQLAELYRSQRRAYEELNQFIEAVHYRDFSRFFDVRHASAEIQSLRKGFNEINSTFRVISKEKETQYQYLQKILELVNTGILSYKEADGEVLWMNESLKQMLRLPYLKTIHSLARRDEGLYNEILSLKPGEAKVASAHPDKQPSKWLLSATLFQTEGQKYKLIAFQNISEALDETEAKAWQKLLSVMTHEIMNSIAPISSLAETLKHRLQQSPAALQTDPGTRDDLELGIDTIRKRSEGLLKFAQTYRNLNKITAPNLKTVQVSDIFANIHQLMQPTMQQKNISLEIVVKDPGLMLEVDPNLIEQVLINLVVNAMEAVKDRPEARIILSAWQATGKKAVIRVADNGTGIPGELLDRIFIPFFSTRKSGSGIGLSLCKQIMLLHRGSIQVQSVENEGSAFQLIF
ncbi:MAG: ATP-binding protein [Chitinophagaceae bacterium]